MHTRRGYSWQENEQDGNEVIIQDEEWKKRRALINTSIYTISYKQIN
jgi:hypothetical protein